MLKKIKLYVSAIIICLVCNLSFSATIISPFNKKILNSDSISNSYSFIAFGHWYGNPMNLHQLLPSRSVLSGIDNFNQHHPAFIMAMGDVYQKADSLTISNFQKLVLNKITVPLFNAAGNHELEKDRDFYESHFGKTIYSFQIKNELYIVLDSEIANCELEGEQLNFLKNCLDSAVNKIDIQNIFIFSHKLIWITLEEKFVHVLNKLYKDYNCYDGTSFKNQVYPKLLETSIKKSIYWLSGDCGFSLFYHKVKDHHLTFLSCGIADVNEDAYLKIDIDEKKNVNIQAHSFNGEKLNLIADYNIDYWSNRVSAPVKPANVLYKAKLIFKNSYFWYGMAFSLILLFVGLLLKRICL